MVKNKLKLNDDKTELMYISSRFYHKFVKLPDFTIDDVLIEPAPVVCNIGVVFDHLMGDHVTAICRAAHFHLCDIGRIRKFITLGVCEKLIHAFVTSRLDCGNATRYG